MTNTNTVFFGKCPLGQWLLRLVLIIGTGIGGAWAVEPPHYPQVLGTFQLVTRADYPQPSLGVVGRYSGDPARRQLVDIFAYPVPEAWAVEPQGDVLDTHFQQLLGDIEAVAGESSGREVRVLERGVDSAGELSPVYWARLRDRRGSQEFDGLLLLAISEGRFFKLRVSQYQPMALDEAMALFQTWAEQQGTAHQTPRPAPAL